MKCANWIQTPFMIHAHPSGVLNFDVIVSPWVHGVSRHCHLLPEWLNMSFYYRSPQYQWMISYSSNCQSLLTCWFLNIFLTQKISCPTGKNTRIRMYRVWWSTFLKLDGDWGRYRWEGWLKASKSQTISWPSRLMSIPFLNSGLLNLDPEQMWISSDV